MATEAATYHRIRSAVSAAHKAAAVTVLTGSTELSLPAAAEYARNFMALEGIHNVRVSIGVGTLEIGPADVPADPAPAQAHERRRRERRSGGDRRRAPRS